jgi:hypothetical protein
MTWQKKTVLRLRPNRRGMSGGIDLKTLKSKCEVIRTRTRGELTAMIGRMKV